MCAQPISQQIARARRAAAPSGELCAGGDGGATLLRSVRSDEDGGNLSEHRSERMRAIKYRAMREQLPSNQCVATPFALSHGCGLIALYTSPYLTPTG
jgi:hypothetical protein